MQIVSSGDTFHEISQPFFRKKQENIINFSSAVITHRVVNVNPNPAEPRYALPLQTV